MCIRDSTLWGRIRTWIAHSPPIYFELSTDTNEVRKYHIVPGMMKTGVILNPLIDTEAQWEGWYTGMKLPRVVSLRLLTPPAPEMIVPHVRLRLVQADRLIPRDAKQLRDALEY